jgi:hypothetical protein
MVTVRRAVKSDRMLGTACATATATSSGPIAPRSLLAPFGSADAFSLKGRL